MTAPLGVVSSGHPATTAAAAEVLRAGGNAFDAAVAGGFAATVAESVLTSLGGGGFLLARPASGRATLFDFFVNTPGLGSGPAGEMSPTASKANLDFAPVTVRFGGQDQIFHAGLAAAATPGTLAGLLAAHEKLGRLELDRVTAPAVRLAREGVVVNDAQGHLVELLPSILTRTDAARALYAPSGRKLAIGDLYRNEDLAAFIAGLPTTAERFYHGDLAARIAADMEARGGLMTQRDLAEYAPIERDPLAFNCGGTAATVLTNPAPSVGGRMVRLTLDLMAAALRSDERDEARCMVALAAAMNEADAVRARGLSDDGTLGTEESIESRDRTLQATRGTTHISVVDRDMNVASMTCSNGEGCGYIVPGTGIMLNNMLGEEDLIETGAWDFEPGVRMASMMAPTIVLRPGEGGCMLALGSGGSKRIRSALAQVISGVLHSRLSLGEAVDRARIHWEDGRLQMEPGLSADVEAALRARFEVNRWERRSVYFGGVNAAAWPAEAAADARRSGAAMIVHA